MKKTNLEVLLLPIVERWWLRFCTKYRQYYLDTAPVYFSTSYRFFALHCGLTRQQSKDISKVFQELGWLRVERAGWRILSPPQEVVGNA